MLLTYQIFKGGILKDYKLSSDGKDIVVNSTRLKEHVLNRLGEGWIAYNKGKEVFIETIKLQFLC